MKLSVVICVYNTAPEYLRVCLDSIVNSTLSDEEREICIVDDGSSIDYSSLLANYKHKYVKTENRGIFSARRTGVGMAEGEYVTFVDSDDTVSINYHLPMIERAMDTGADIVINDWAFHTERCRYFCRRDTTVERDLLLDGDDILTAFTAQAGREHSFFVLWNKIYSAKLIKRAMDLAGEVVSLRPRFSFSEDALINFFAHREANRLANVHSGYYFYRIHDEQTVKVVSREKLADHIECMALTLDAMERGAEGRENSFEIKKNIDLWRALMSRTHFSYAKSGGYTDLYPLIAERYGCKKLRGSTLRDGSVYAVVTILPSNFSSIDAQLLQIFRTDGEIAVSDAHLHPYVKKTLEFMKDHGVRVKFSRKNGIKLEPPRVSLKLKIVHNYLLYTIGNILFPKGSRIRAALKKLV